MSVSMAMRSSQRLRPAARPSPRPASRTALRVCAFQVRGSAGERGGGSGALVVSGGGDGGGFQPPPPPPRAHVQVTFKQAAGGKEATVECAADDYLLDAADAQRVDLPASCRGGAWGGGGCGGSWARCEQAGPH